MGSKRVSTNYRSSINQKHSTITESPKREDFSAANPIKFIPHSINRSALYDKGCVTCGKDNILVKYYGERHICLRCREFLRTQNNEKAHVFLNDDGEIQAVGEKKNENGEKEFFYFETDLLWFKEYRCYATLAGEDELIILLHDNQTVKKNLEKKKPILKEKI